MKRLNTRDRELLKSVFSEDALAKDTAIDEGIDYLFGLYEGDFIEVTERNHSSADHWGEPGRTKEISAWCNVETSKATYELHFDLWAIQEQEPEKQGVYSVQLFEYVEGEYPAYYPMAGIQTPDRACVNKTIDMICDFLENRNVGILREYLSSQLLDIENWGKKANKILQLFDYDFAYSDVGDIWTTDTSTETQRRRHAYMELDVPKGDYILYFRYENWDDDKISMIKVTKIEEGTSEEDYALGEELTEPGIYLP